MCVCLCGEFSSQTFVKAIYEKLKLLCKKKKTKKNKTTLSHPIIEDNITADLEMRSATFLQRIPLRLSHPHRGGQVAAALPPPCLWLSRRQSQQFQPTLLPLTLATLWEKISLVELPITSSYTTRETTCNYYTLFFIFHMHSLPAGGETDLAVFAEKESN